MNFENYSKEELANMKKSEQGYLLLTGCFAFIFSAFLVLSKVYSLYPLEVRLPIASISIVSIITLVIFAIGSLYKIWKINKKLEAFPKQKNS